MKFSYLLLKRLSSKVPSKASILQYLNAYSFEATDAGGSVLDISVPPNRYSDAASHAGLVRELSAITGKALTLSAPKPLFSKQSAPFRIRVTDAKRCRRYRGQYFENVSVRPSPKWLQDILRDCGIRPINNVVDIMNYVMLETGQPLHAFDFEKIEPVEIKNQKSKVKSIEIRKANKNEFMVGLDGITYELPEGALIIADAKGPLAIAGVKGGDRAEVTSATSRIFVEAANFDGVSVYATSRDLNLSTDASVRFSHDLSLSLIDTASSRAAILLTELTGAVAQGFVDTALTKERPRALLFDLEQFHRLIGVTLERSVIERYLTRLGFSCTAKMAINGRKALLVQVPAARTDILGFEDLAEEVIRLHGYQALPSVPPHIHLIPSGFEDRIVFKDKARTILTIFGLSEVYTYAFVSDTDIRGLYPLSEQARYGAGADEPRKKDKDESMVVEVDNPISTHHQYLRPTLSFGLVKSLLHNVKQLSDVKLFEIGTVFQTRRLTRKLTQINADSIQEHTALGIGYASSDRNVFFDVKGAVRELLHRMGIVDVSFAVLSSKHVLPLISKRDFSREGLLTVIVGNVTVGYIAALEDRMLHKGSAAIAELNIDELLRIAVREHEYKPLPKYPSVMRDISVVLGTQVKIGDVVFELQQSYPDYIENVDLVDEYRDSMTFRIVFQAEDRTLTDEEVNAMMEHIAKILTSRFKAKVR